MEEEKIRKDIKEKDLPTTPYLSESCIQDPASTVTGNTQAVTGNKVSDDKGNAERKLIKNEDSESVTLEAPTCGIYSSEDSDSAIGSPMSPSLLTREEPIAGTDSEPRATLATDPLQTKSCAGDSPGLELHHIGKMLISTHY